MVCSRSRLGPYHSGNLGFIYFLYQNLNEKRNVTNTWFVCIEIQATMTQGNTLTPTVFWNSAELHLDR